MPHANHTHPLFFPPPCTCVDEVTAILCFHLGGGVYSKPAMHEVDSGRDRATPTSVRHDDDEPLTTISPCYCTRAARPSYCQHCQYWYVKPPRSVKLPRRDHWSVGNSRNSSVPVLHSGAPVLCLFIAVDEPLTRWTLIATARRARGLKQTHYGANSVELGQGH